MTPMATIVVGAVMAVTAAPVIGVPPAEATTVVIDLLHDAAGLHHVAHAGHGGRSHRACGRRRAESKCARHHHDESEQQLPHCVFISSSLGKNQKHIAADRAAGRFCATRKITSYANMSFV